MAKILSTELLVDEIRAEHDAGRSVVHCHGTFDLLHTGHIRHLQSAARQGDLLVATLTADDFVNKGPGRPVFTEHLRAENLAALACVDYVAINRDRTATGLIRQMQPDVYVKGGEYREAAADVTGQLQPEKLALESYGGRLHFTDDITFSSTKLLNEHFNVFDDRVKQFLDRFKLQYSAEDVMTSLDQLRGKRVLVVGDAIVDEYHYTQPLGQTGKGNALAVRFRDAEQFAGGAVAVANHIAGFAGEVSLLTGLGKEDSYESFIRSRLQDNVRPEFVMFPGSTVRKRRFVDPNMTNLFEVYYGLDRPVPTDVEQRACRWIEAEAAAYDVVVVPDFGNGLLTANMVESISRHARFLSLNTQVNSMNRGFHIVTRYPRADFVSLNEPELRMAARDQHAPVVPLAQRMAEQLDLRQLTVTRGTQGVLCVDRERDELIDIPALTNSVVDRIGAGDAFLALAGTAIGCGLPPLVAGFAGSAAAAMSVQIVCNREPVKPPALYKFMQTLLK